MQEKVTADIVGNEFLSLVEKLSIEYVIIGGLAVGVVGEARVTEDIDVMFMLKRKKVGRFLTEARKSGFSWNEKAVKEDIELKGAFRIFYKGFHIDIILASTNFDQGMFKRKQRVKLFNKETYVPSPEDLIILKIIPGRPKDLLDAESVYIRHKKNIDLKYLEKWSQWFSDEAEDMRIYNNLKKILKGLKF